MILALAGEGEGWRWIFFVNLPIGVVALLLAAQLIPRTEPGPRGHLDVVGVALLGGGVLAAMLPFTQLGIAGWAARARAELDGIGERPVARPGAPDLVARLTPQEVQVVRLAAGGLSNKEIGAQLFLSPRTVGHHLYRSFSKLGIGRRIELAQLDL